MPRNIEQKRHRVGVLLNSLLCSPFIYDTVKELANQPDIDLILLLESEEPRSFRSKVVHKIRHRGFLRLFSLLLFAFVTKFETLLVSMVDPRVRDVNRTVEIDHSVFSDSINLSPQYSKSRLYNRYLDDEVETVRQADLDIIVRGNGGAIIRGGILDASRFGIASFHHGDNRWNRGGPPGFWEVFTKRADTGFIIQILGQKLDAGGVLLRGGFGTKRTYTENRQQLIAESNPYLCETVLGLLRGEIELEFEPRLPLIKPVLVAPSAWKMVQYVVNTIVLFTGRVINRKILRRYPRWSVGYVRSPWRMADFNRLKKIENPKNRFFADPFLIRRDDRTYIFVEDYSYHTRKGTISCIVVDENDAVSVIDNVVEEDFHLSFPYLLEHDGSLFMIPESVEGRAIRLYRCVGFPAKWEFEMELMSAVSAADTLVLEREGKWYLLTCNSSFESSEYNGSQLDVYVANKLLTKDWKRLSYLPKIFDPLIGRNGGLVVDDDGSIGRVRQSHGFDNYGEKLSIARIMTLSSDDYSELEIAQIPPTFARGIEGTHHLHSTDGMTVIDFVKTERISSGIDT